MTVTCWFFWAVMATLPCCHRPFDCSTLPILQLAQVAFSLEVPWRVRGPVLCWFRVFGFRFSRLKDPKPLMYWGCLPRGCVSSIKLSDGCVVTWCFNISTIVDFQGQNSLDVNGRPNDCASEIRCLLVWLNWSQEIGMIRIETKDMICMVWSGNHLIPKNNDCNYCQLLSRWHRFRFWKRRTQRRRSRARWTRSSRPRPLWPWWPMWSMWPLRSLWSLWHRKRPYEGPWVWCSANSFNMLSFAVESHLYFRGCLAKVHRASESLTSSWEIGASWNMLFTVFYHNDLWCFCLGKN